MSCPTCGHTMQKIVADIIGDEMRVYQCPRCGTTTVEDSCQNGAIICVPLLVGRCREFEAEVRRAAAVDPSHSLSHRVLAMWQRCGIEAVIRQDRFDTGVEGA